jgi:indole-3-acetate monooxygenase
MGEIISDRVAECLERVRQLAPIIADHADESERDSQLAPATVNAFHDSGLFRIMLPARLGGCDLNLGEMHRVCEEVARVDGSAGWNFVICAGGPILGGFVAREAFEKIFSDPRALIAGSLNPMTTTVIPDAGGFRFTGKATFASGSAQASWLITGGIVMRDGSPQFVEGSPIPLLRAGAFPISNAHILDTWKVSALRGTGSNDCAFENIFVPEAFTFEWPEPRTTWRTGPFTHIPLMTQLGGGFTAVALGIARHAIDTLKELAVAKVPTGSRSSLRDRPVMQTQLAQAEGWLQAGRAYFYSADDEIWRRGEAGAVFDLPARASARLAYVTAARLAAQAVDLVYDAAGITAIQTTCPIERCWRDAHAITQHVGLSTSRYETLGRVFLGLDPGSPMV